MAAVTGVIPGVYTSAVRGSVSRAMTATETAEEMLAVSGQGPEAVTRGGMGGAVG